MRNQLELRALDPVGRLLIRRLIVPRIYYEAQWPGFAGGKIDLLAVDRDGTGDAHLVEIKHDARDALALAAPLVDAVAPYRWVAFFRGTEDAASIEALVSHDPLYRKGSPGQVGVIEVFAMEGGELGAVVRMAAERFPTPAYEMAQEFARTHEAQIRFAG